MFGTFAGGYLHLLGGIFLDSKEINVAGPIISVGVFVITLSASLANLIGATKILHAVAKDKLFGKERGGVR